MRGVCVIHCQLKMFAPTVLAKTVATTTTKTKKQYTHKCTYTYMSLWKLDLYLNLKSDQL